MSGLQIPGDVMLNPIRRLKDIAQKIEVEWDIQTVQVGLRNARVREARNQFIHEAYFEHKFTQEEIADYLGYKDHTTVNHYLNHKFHIQNEKD